LAEVHQFTAALLYARGDLRGSAPQHEQALELHRKIGDEKRLSWAAHGLAFAYLGLGEIRRAEEYASRAVGIADSVGHDPSIVWAYGVLGIVSLVQGTSERAIAASQRAVDLSRNVSRNVGDRVWEAGAIYSLGRACLAQGDRRAALKQFQEALTRVPPGTTVAGGWPFLCTSAAVLSGLEEAHEDPEEFRALCRRYREERPEAPPSRFVQWYLEPAEPSSVFRSAYSVLPAAPSAIRNTQHAILDPGWVWHDPFADCSLTVQNGLEIHAANGRDLWHINLSAPRLLRPASADFAIQTVCLRASDEKPAIGGLLLWKDQENFLRLERGAKGKHEITFEGCVADEHYQFGRGRLVSDRVFLRLERRGPRVDAFCSADGEEWFTAGHVEFPVEDPMEVGLHALGAIDRLIYPDAYPEGTAIRFESFQLGAPS
jgi:tetratricopeptide (TPR) repeat protein